MSKLYFIDTSILLYSISSDPAEDLKRQKAVALINECNAALSVQVLQEFYVQATRLSRTHRLTHELAAGLMQAWTRFPGQAITLSILDGALEIKAARGFSYLDSAIIATARALGCRTLHSEDMSHGSQIGRCDDRQSVSLIGRLTSSRST